jgi:ERCC4-type nuclease
MEQGIRLIRTEDGRDSAAWLSRLAHRRAERLKRDRPIYSQRRRPPATDAGEALLAAVPGISTVSVRAVLRHFGTVAAVLAASPQDRQDVPGIGPDRARALASTLNQRFSS